MFLSQSLSAFEMILFPSVKMNLDRKLEDFMPYALQLMAQFIELDNASSDDIREICLSQDLDSENLAGLVRLIQTVLPIAPETFIHVLPYALPISKRLVSSPRTEKQWF